jgi:hypothetical protein
MFGPAVTLSGNTDRADDHAMLVNDPGLDIRATQINSEKQGTRA